MSQYIPLPAFQDLGTKSEFEDFFQEARTPIFLLIFIGVLLVQIFYKQKKQKAEHEKALSTMGPLERSLQGKSPNG